MGETGKRERDREKEIAETNRDMIEEIKEETEREREQIKAREKEQGIGEREKGER